ncbi:conserved hypothetical protein [Paraburkholderia sacchari]|uniref:hypothetical protein n=1 Tax=Paraburkholderia sacchari TaxID=159450 RepID=UPI0039A6825D
MEYKLIDAILHGQRLGEPLTWIYLAAVVAASIAGWKFGGLTFEISQRIKDED